MKATEFKNTYNEHFEEPSEQTSFFPLFIDIRDRNVLVIGGGNVAERRINILAPFGVRITVISPTFTEQIKYAASQGVLHLIEKKYQIGDITDIKPFLVIAATNNRQTNQAAMKEAVSLNIPISVADCREECSCCFPAIAESKNYIAGIVSKNGNHKGVKRIAERTRELLNTCELL